jgi:hypothetical protein
MGHRKVAGAREDDGRADGGTDLSELIVLPPPVLAHRSSLLLARKISTKLGICQGIFGAFFQSSAAEESGDLGPGSSGGVGLIGLGATVLEG